MTTATPTHIQPRCQQPVRAVTGRQGRLQPVTCTRSRLIPLAVAAFVALVGCSSTSADETSTDLATADEQVLGHVHGLGVDPADDALYVASHFGIFRVKDGKRERVADRWQDTMGFVVVGPGHFLGSGHPDPRENLPPSLGLVESTDAGESWEPVSLLGEADLHSIEHVDDTTYAYDSTSQSLISTSDGQRWDTIVQLLPLLDIAVDPGDADTVYMATGDGELLRSAKGGEPSPVRDAPTLVAIDWEVDGPLVGVRPDGTVMVSADGRTGWQKAGVLDGPAEALDVIPGRWHAATQSGVHESTDDGASWELVLERRVTPED
jgi:hypothetical protein